MKTKRIDPFVLEGSLHMQSSKSIAQRVLFLSVFAEHAIELVGLNQADDVQAVMAAIQALGVETQAQKGSTILHPHGDWKAADVEINIGESGLGFRMLCMLAAFRNGTTQIYGRGSLLKRNHLLIRNYLTELGVAYEMPDDLLPITIFGGAGPGAYRFSGAASSQALTGLLTVMPFLNASSELRIDDAVSIGYLDLTEDVLRQMGISMYHQSWELVGIEAPQHLQAKHMVVEGDWSAAANFIVGAAIAGRLSLGGLHQDSKQADRVILDALSAAGGRYVWKDAELVIEQADLKPFQFDATHCPDLFPPLVLLAAACEGTSELMGVRRLFNKESNRAASLKEMFAQFGVSITYDASRMLVHGTGRIKAAKVGSYGDHRMAMVAAMAATLADAAIIIEHPEVVHKSYPTFFQELERSARLKST